MPVTSDPSARRFRIEALLSKGSSGRIYRAVMEDPDGSELDVALKLFGDEELRVVPLARLQEEARRLAPVDDRAIVRVEPPIQLGDLWGMVMDLVTGVSLQRLTSLGPMPAHVVAEILQEVARVLHKVWNAPGPDGRPLRIMHRDLKPSNLQLNAGGELRILDFGIAKADFRTRDAQTAAYATGTRAFVSPERVEGIDTPAGDVYSLGVTAHVLLGDDRGPGRSTPADPVAQSMIALVARMRADDPQARPTAQEVERACANLRRRSRGETLRQWAERNVPRAIAVRFSDRIVGTVLTSTGRARGGSGRAPRTPPGPAATPPTAARTRSAPPAPTARSARTRTSTPPPASRARRSDPPPAGPPRSRTPSAAPPPTAPRADRAPPGRVPRSSPPPPAVRGPRTSPPAAERASRSSIPAADRAPQRTPVPTPRTVTRSSAPPAGRAADASTPATVARALPAEFGSERPSPSAEPVAARRSRPVPSVAPAPLFPKQLHDAETVAADRSSFASMLGDDAPPPRASNTGRVAAAAAPRPLPPSRAATGAGARRGWMVGMLATGMLASGLVGGLALIAAAGAWWMWPDDGDPVADTVPVRAIDPGTGLMNDDELVELLSQAPLPPPDGLRLTFNSVPFGADVHIDGKLMGQTPLIGVKVTEGPHEVTLLSDFERVTRTVEAGAGKPTRFVWRGGDAWEQHKR